MTSCSRLLDVVAAQKLLPDGNVLFEDVNISLEAGESISLVGKSGSGKSTLLSVLGLLDSFDSGQHWFDGQEVRLLTQRTLDDRRGKKIGFVFQRFALIPHLNVVENVMVPLRHSSSSKFRSMRDTAMASLARVDMSAMAGKKPRELSGGEQQRVAIARALVTQPKLILADEPTGSLDEKTGGRVMDLLLEIGTTDGSGLIVVTHDASVASLTTRSARMQAGTLVRATTPSSASDV